MTSRLLPALAGAIAAALLCGATVAAASGPAPGSPAYVQRDNQNMLDAYGRQTGPNGQHVALYLLDLDGFSVINNGLGMDEGDRLLKDVALDVAPKTGEPADERPVHIQPMTTECRCVHTVEPAHQADSGNH